MPAMLVELDGVSQHYRLIVALVALSHLAVADIGAAGITLEYSSVEG
jgi:hypothetical protein